MAIVITEYDQFVLYTGIETLRNAFDKYGRGVFVVIKNRTLTDFFVFDNVNYVNDWHHKVLTPVDTRALLVTCSHLAGFSFKDELCYYPELKNWRANGNLLRGDNKLSARHFKMADIIRKGLQMVDCGDCMAFINTRDFPQDDALNMCEPVAGRSPLIPTWDDFEDLDHKIFPPWEQRNMAAIWRGSNTGDGTRHLLVKQFPQYAQFVKWTVRPKLNKDFTIEVTAREKGITLSPWMPIEKQAINKWTIVVDGHVAAFRIRHCLAAGMTVLWVETEWRVWYQHLLVPWTHYIPVARDLSDLEERITFCRNNDDKARAIAFAGRQLYERHLRLSNVFEHFFVVLCGAHQEKKDF